jgi:nucleotide-binding universal stress UspA family protein
MVEIRRILCPIDFSEASRHALEHALAIAKWYGSRITALHVIHEPPLPVPPVLIGAGADVPAVTPPDRRAAMEEELRAWVQAGSPDVKTEVFVDEGPAGAIILENERFVLGSVTEKVLRKAGCPVMTVPPASQTIAKVPYTRLLCPVDFSDSSIAALQFAFSIAEESDAKLTILHVLDWPPDSDLLTQRFDMSAYRRLIEEETGGRLDALVPADARVWCKPVTKVAYGKPYREILQVAEADRDDLILIGVRGRNPLDLTVFGSTTNQVVRRASCPVLTLRQ